MQLYKQNNLWLRFQQVSSSLSFQCRRVHVCVCSLYLCSFSSWTPSSICSSAEKWVKFTVDSGRFGGGSTGADSSLPLFCCLWILKQQTVSEDRFLSFKSQNIKKLKNPSKTLQVGCRLILTEKHSAGLSPVWNERDVETQHDVHKWNNKRLEMGGGERKGNQVFDVVRLISLPEGGSGSPLSAETACDSRGFPRRSAHFHCDFFFAPFGDFRHEKLCLWLVFYVAGVFFHHPSWTDGEGLEEKQEESDYKITFAKNPLKELLLVQRADTAAHGCHSFCFFLPGFGWGVLKRSWIDLQVANCGRFADQPKDIVTG